MRSLVWFWVWLARYPTWRAKFARHPEAHVGQNAMRTGTGALMALSSGERPR